MQFHISTSHLCAVRHFCAAHLCASFILFLFNWFIYLFIYEFARTVIPRLCDVMQFHISTCISVRWGTSVLFCYFFFHLKKTWDRIRTCNVILFTGDLTFLVNLEQSILQTGTRSEWFHPPKGQLLDRCQPRLSGVFVPQEWLCSWV